MPKDKSHFFVNRPPVHMSQSVNYRIRLFLGFQGLYNAGFLLSKGRRCGHVPWRERDAIVTLGQRTVTARTSARSIRQVTLSRLCRGACLEPSPSSPAIFVCRACRLACLQRSPLALAESSHFCPSARARSNQRSMFYIFSFTDQPRFKHSMRWHRLDLAPLTPLVRCWHLQTRPPSSSSSPLSSSLASSLVLGKKCRGSRCLSTVWSWRRAFHFLMLLARMGSTLSNTLICESFISVISLQYTHSLLTNKQ